MSFVVLFIQQLISIACHRGNLRNVVNEAEDPPTPSPTKSPKSASKSASKTSSPEKANKPKKKSPSKKKSAAGPKKEESLYVEPALLEPAVASGKFPDDSNLTMIAAMNQLEGSAKVSLSSFFGKAADLEVSHELVTVAKN